MVEPQRKAMPDVIILEGPSGVGKSALATRYCQLKYPNEEPYRQDGIKWWDGYNGEQSVIIDDFAGAKGGSDWSWTWWKKVCDRYPMRVQRKGGSRQLRVKTIIFTTNEAPTEWYDISWVKWQDEGLRRVALHMKVDTLVDEDGFYKQGRRVMSGDDIIELVVPARSTGYLWEYDPEEILCDATEESE